MISGGGVDFPLGGAGAGLAGTEEIGRVRGISMRGIAGRGVSALDIDDFGTGPPGIGILEPGRLPIPDAGFDWDAEGGGAGGAVAALGGVGVDAGAGSRDSLARVSGLVAGIDSGFASLVFVGWAAFDAAAGGEL
ncbi:MAG: hypothetical protein KF838_05195 [Phycisphaeraceae bacterium]|nr:MAG: hypothetical protein KF838_05195 [Phycisphaeraceae bacterium]